MGGDGRSVNQENRTQEKGDGERLQKVLAQAGVASRRHSEQLIVEGRVTVNGNKVTVLGTKVSISDRIQVDGHPVYRSVELHYYLLNKPVSVITSASDPQAVSYTHLRAHETRHDIVCRLLLEKKNDQDDRHMIDVS